MLPELHFDFGRLLISGFSDELASDVDENLDVIFQELYRYRNQYMGVSDNKGPYYSTLNGRIPIIRTPK